MRKGSPIPAGSTFGRWTTEEVATTTKDRCLCRCVCGNARRVSAWTLLDGRSQSCGCLHKEVVTKHAGAYQSEYSVWIAMKERCNNPNTINYHNYGGRGIEVCDRWRESFANFYADMGPRPSLGHSIDRYPDVNGNYEPGNCRRADKEQQENNRRTNRVYEHGGLRLTRTQWARRHGLNPSTLKNRLESGMPFAEAIDMPVEEVPRLAHDGRELTAAQWAEITGLAAPTIRQRIKRGWSVEKTLTTPVPKLRRPLSIVAVTGCRRRG